MWTTLFSKLQNNNSYHQIFEQAFIILDFKTYHSKVGNEAEYMLVRLTCATRRFTLYGEVLKCVLIALVSVRVQILPHASAHHLNLVQFLSTEERTPSTFPLPAHRSDVRERRAAHLTQRSTHT